MTNATSTETTSDLHIERTFDAPRSLVWEAWSKEEHLVEWFGPRQFPAVSFSHDLRNGGRFDYVMRGEDGTDLPGGGEYLEVVDGERIVARSRIEVDGNVIFEVEQTYSFSDAQGGGTTFTLDCVVLKDENFPGRAGMEQGWNETLDRLDEHVARIISA